MYLKERGVALDLDSVNVSKMLIQFKPLLHRTLQRLQVYPHHLNYDDYFQELQIKLLDIYNSFDGDPLANDDDRYRFTAFVGKGLYWKGIDLFKHKSFNTLPILEDEHLVRQIDEEFTASDMTESNIYLEEYFQFAKKRLTESEYLLFKYLAGDEYTITEIAEKMQLSRNSIYKKKDKIKMKVDKLRKHLMS